MRRWSSARVAVIATRSESSIAGTPVWFVPCCSPGCDGRRCPISCRTCSSSRGPVSPRSAASDAFAAWVATIARNRAFEHQRRHVEFTELREVEGRTSSESDAFEMLDTIAALPEAYRETLVLRFVEGMTGPEIASRTGLAEGSVRVNLHRGTKLLRERLRSMERGS